MRLSIPLLLAMQLCGCATAEYTLPCTVVVEMTIEGSNQSDADCHKMKNLRNHQGRLLGPDERVNGCANRKADTIIARDNDATIAHEVRHFLKWYCGQKSVVEKALEGQ